METKVKITKRITAFLLDILLVYLLISLITSIRFINPTYDKFMDAYEKYTVVLEQYYDGAITDKEFNERNQDNIYEITKYSISSNVVIILVLVGYFGLFQKFNNGQTLGKKIMKIKVISVDDKPVSIGKYMLRILPTYYAYIGSVIPLIINSILVFILNSSKYAIANSIVIYAFFFLAIVSFVMMCVREDKRGIHDLISGTKVVME